MRKYTLFILAVVASVIAACSDSKPGSKTYGHSTDELKMTGDSTVYGLACEGCSDSVIYLLPNDGSDPVKYNIFDAKLAGKVLGDISTGDWIGLVRNKKDSMVADLVIDLDELKGIWCYIVMPQLKDVSKMSRKAQQRYINGMSDSLKQIYMVPREYGFWLKRQWESQSVGYVRQVSSLADESPVEYPPLGYFLKWHILNGKFVMTSGRPKYGEDNTISGYDNLSYDTCTIDFLGHDSLVLSDRDGTRSYYRKNDISEVNKKAQEIANRLSKAALEKTTAEDRN